jgi:hypothetical protein
LRQAADIQERIERLQQELDALFQGGKAAESALPPPKNERSMEPALKPQRRPAASRGRGRRRGSPSGPLAPAVVQVLKAKGAPMNVAEILEGLRANGYRYAAANPKKNLGARIYRLRGIKQVGPGRFAAE